MLSQSANDKIVENWLSKNDVLVCFEMKYYELGTKFNEYQSFSNRKAN